jgi:catechol 2,3-dioxygenase-like lactoylglutathione lyase family enzyme
MPKFTDVLNVAVPVDDQERALTFYSETLGFETRLDDVIGEGMRWIEVAPPGATTAIALVLAGDGIASGVDTGVRLATRDAEADHGELQARGVDVGELLRWEGVPPMFVLRDPDGNTLYVVEQP